MRLVIADDHKILRDCIKALLKNEENIEVVGEAATGIELLEIFPLVKPDVVLLDIEMPMMNGWDTMAKLNSNFNFKKVVALSMLKDKSSIKRMMNAGASGYILKTASKEEILYALMIVNSGGKYINPDISLSLLNDDSDQQSHSYDFPSSRAISLISKRELEVLKLIAEGLTNGEIADKLFNSKRTIESHRRNLIEKTGTKNTAELIKYAYSKGYLNLEAEVEVH